MNVVGITEVRRVWRLSFRGYRKTVSKESLNLIGIPSPYQGLTWEDYRFQDSSLEKIFKGYTEHCDAMYQDCINLFITGSNASGKTLAASIILQQCFNFYYKVKMGDFKDFIAKTFAGNDTSDYYDVEFLVIDELGAEVNLKSSAEKSLLEELLKKRFAFGYPTIICSNLSIGQLKERYGNTVASMLNDFVKITIISKDGRQEAFRKKKALSFLK